MTMKSQVSQFSARQLICLLSVMAFLLFVLGCGASRKETSKGDESIDIEDLLGEDEVASSNQTSDEAEVLRLLGITPADEATAQPQIAAVSQQSEVENVADEVEDLREDLTQKDQEISELRAQLTQKEIKISDLETQTTKSPKVKSYPAGKAGEPSREFKLRYQDALGQFKARNYQTALSIFLELVQNAPVNSLSDNCQYWIGECYYGLVNYNQAISEFERVFSHANSNKSDDAQLKLGLCYLKLGDKVHARAEFSRLLSDYPDSEYRAAAQRHIDRL